MLVCVKSFDSETAAKRLKEAKGVISDDTRIVLFQNGWGNAEKFLKYFDAERIYGARVITGFRKTGDNCVDITVHAEAIHVGSLFSDKLSCLGPLCSAINKGGIPCEVTKDVVSDLWAKMLYNCALNGLGAILDVSYGELANSEYTRGIMEGICREVFLVMSAAGYKTHWPAAEEFLNTFYGRLVPDTAGHKSSTLQDILAGKRTEIDALNGAVISLAQKHGIEVPFNRAVYNMVRFIESRQ